MKSRFTGNKDIDKLILLRLNGPELLRTCSSSKYLNTLCDESLFENILKNEYPYLHQKKEIFYKDMKWRNYYAIQMYYIAKLQEEFGIPYIPNPNFVPELFYKTNKDRKDKYNDALFYAASIPEIAKLLVQKGGDYAPYIRNAIFHAAEQNKKNIMYFLIDKYPQNQLIFQYNLYDEALIGAAAEGHLDLAKELISKGAINYDEVLENAAKNGKLNIIKYFLDELGYNDNQSKLNALYSAVANNHPNIVKYLVEEKRVKIDSEDVDEAIGNENLPMLKYLVEHGGRSPFGKNIARKTGNKEIIKYVNEKL